MGDITDDLINNALSQEDEFQNKDDKYNTTPGEWRVLREKVRWTTKDKEKLAVKDMTTDHINNTLEYLKRNQKSPEWIKCFEVELKHFR